MSNKAREGGGGRRSEGLAATGSTTAEKADPSASASAEAAAGKSLPFRGGDVGGDVADEKEQVCRDDVRREERAAGDDQDASGCTDVVVVVKTRKKSKKDKVGRKTEGKKHEKPAAPSRSPEPEEQGRLAECLCVPRPRPLKVRGYVRICTCRSHAVSLPLALCVVLLSRVSTLSFVSSLSSVSLHSEPEGEASLILDPSPNFTRIR